MDVQKRKMKPMYRRMLIISCIVFFLFILIAVAVYVCNTYTLQFNVKENTTVFAEANGNLPEVEAVYKGNLLCRSGKHVDVKMEGEVNLNQIGIYPVTYYASYKGLETSISTNIEVRDTTPPEIQLVTNEDSFTSPNAKYVEEGYTAVDNYDGDLTSKVVREERDNIVYYTVSDSSGNQTTVEREIVYKDVVAPVVNLKGKKELKVAMGTEYVEPGYIATDDCDGELTKKVVVEGTVNVEECGEYLLTYRVEDSYGNVGTAERKVIVQETVEVEAKDKVVYLTFDDGPGEYTQQLLDTLDKYGVKVTFFVTNQNSNYQDLIGEAYRRGHTIAMHTYSHDYSKIYQNEQAYYEDLENIKQICITQTGVAPTIVRFPGGTSNTVSKKYCVGIMSALVESLEYNGYYYSDWNVSSGDAGGTKTKEGVVENVISGIKKNRVSVVLQHDIKKYSVEAVGDIIEWGLANGYTFLPMTEDSEMVHFNAKN